MWSLPRCLEADSIPPESTSRSVTKLTNHSSRASRALHQKANPISDAHSRNEAKIATAARSLLISNLAEALRKGGRNCQVLKMVPLISKAQHHLPGCPPLLQIARPYALHIFVKQFPGCFVVFVCFFFLCYPLLCRQWTSRTPPKHAHDIL